MEKKRKYSFRYPSISKEFVWKAWKFARKSQTWCGIMIEILLEKWVKITARNIAHLHKLLLEGDMVQQVKTRGVFLSWLSMEAGTRRLIATFFGICSRLLGILFATFPSLVYSPYICHSRLLKVRQTPTSYPIENPGLSQWLAYLILIFTLYMSFLD